MLPFQPTRKQRISVEQMKACGESDETIARALGISRPTLLKYFSNELTFGWARQRQQIVAMIFAGAKKGNPTLMKRADELTRMGLAKVNDPEATADAPRRAVAIPKKEAVRQAAIAAGDDPNWGDDLRPPPDVLN